MTVQGRAAERHRAPARATPTRHELDLPPRITIQSLDRSALQAAVVGAVFFIAPTARAPPSCRYDRQSRRLSDVGNQHVVVQFQPSRFPSPALADLAVMGGSNPSPEARR
jgi:hypothetical protein